MSSPIPQHYPSPPPSTYSVGSARAYFETSANISKKALTSPNYDAKKKMNALLQMMWLQNVGLLKLTDDHSHKMNLSNMDLGDETPESKAYNNGWKNTKDHINKLKFLA